MHGTDREIKEQRATKKLAQFLLCGGIVVFLLLTAGCAGVSSQPVHASQQPVDSGRATGIVDHIELIHFHTDQQCDSCVEVGRLAEETVNEFFPREIASGKLVFRHINIDDPSNRNFVGQYGVTGSSLWIGIFDAGGAVHRQQDLDVWYLTGDEVAYKAHLSGIITRRLHGDLS